MTTENETSAPNPFEFTNKASFTDVALAIYAADVQERLKKMSDENHIEDDGSIAPALAHATAAGMLLGTHIDAFKNEEGIHDTAFFRALLEVLLVGMIKGFRGVADTDPAEAFDCIGMRVEFVQD